MDDILREIEVQLEAASRAMITAEYHHTLMTTYIMGSILWQNELGAMIDSMREAADIYQGAFDQLEESNHARS